MKKVLLTAALLLSTTYNVKAATVTSDSGQEFDVVSVPGNGNCAFTSIGKSRDEVVAALKASVKENEGVYKSFNASRSSIHTAVAALRPEASANSVEAVLAQVDSFISSSAAMYVSDPDYRSPSKLATAALSEFRSGLGSFSEAEFVSARKLLQSRIENMYFERYEAFQVALKEELKESGVNASNLSTEAGLLQSIDTVFAKNTGRSSWLPMGLIFGVQERLGLNLAVWSSRGEPAGSVKLYQSSADVADPSVIHVRWNGGHFDVLKPRS
jgi:hypothetical protein